MTHKLYLQYVDRDKKNDFLIIAVNVDENTTTSYSPNLKTQQNLQAA